MNKETVLSALKRRLQSGRERRRSPILEPASPLAEPRSGSFDFSQLPAHKQLRMLAAAADFYGVGNPFFQVHEGCAGAATVIKGRELINFASYNYLGLNGHPEVSAAAKLAIDRYGISAGASRLVAGERPVHRQLELKLADFFGTEDALVFVSGHATNVSAIGHLMGREDLIICDALSHNSIFEGVKLSGAARLTFPHNNIDALNALLRDHRARFKQVLIAVEGLYSMDGDCPDLRAIVQLKRDWDSWLLVDEAHSAGVLGSTGRGIAEEQGIDRSDAEIWMGTLSKTFASTGGYIAGSQALIDILRAGAPGFVYSVGLPPALAAAAHAAIQILEREPERLSRLRQNSALFLKRAREKGLQTGDAINGSVIPVPVGDSLKAVIISEKLSKRGVNAMPIIFPAVAHKEARLRFFITSEHTSEQIDAAVEAISETVAELAAKRTIYRLKRGLQ
jgi:8-amino-7-oxononanoate synthase